MLLNAFTQNGISFGGDEQRLIGLMNRMRLFAPSHVVTGAEAVLRGILEIALKPSIELRQLAKQALAKSLDPDPLLAFSEIGRADLDSVRRGVARPPRPLGTGTSRLFRLPRRERNRSAAVHTVVQ